MDLNFALLRTAHKFRTSQKIHFIIAFVFHLPFASSSFDLAESIGVLHHTYSTEGALRRVAEQVRDGGQMFIWLYAREDILSKSGFRSIPKIAFHAMQAISRPILSRAPGWARNLAMLALSAAIHPMFRASQGKNWTFRNSEHNLRDSFTPRFYRYHGFNEVGEWIESMGFSYELASPSEYRKVASKPLDGIGMLCTKRALSV